MGYEGDPKLFPCGDACDLEIVNGQPIMDDGLENAVFLSIFTTAQWWGNSVALDDAERYLSRFNELQRRTLTEAALLDAEEYAKAALAWLVAGRIAASVTVAASIMADGFLGLEVVVSRPDRSQTIRYSVNWDTMEARTL
jgi:phage gp46-like protein